MGKDAAKELVGGFGKVSLSGDAYYSMDNTMAHVVFLLAREYMSAEGQSQWEMYEKIAKKTKDPMSLKHAKSCIKVYKKIDKAIKSIEKIIGSGDFDCIVDEELREHTDVLWKNRGILWF